MYSISFKVAACLAGGLLFLISGCSPVITGDSGATPVQVEADANPAANPENNEQRIRRIRKLLSGECMPLDWRDSDFRGCE